MMGANPSDSKALKFFTHPTSAAHRGMIQRVENGLSAFDLRPFGKPIFDPDEEKAAPANPLSKFLNRA